MFEKNLFEPYLMNLLAAKLQEIMQTGIKKVVNVEINANPQITKLVEFYNDEFGDSDAENKYQENVSSENESPN